MSLDGHSQHLLCSMVAVVVDDDEHYSGLQQKPVTCCSSAELEDLMAIGNDYWRNG